MKRILLLVACMILPVLPPGPAVAQAPDTVPRNVHTRAHAKGDTTLALDGVQLFVPAGAVAPGAVVGLGTGGVPEPNGGPAVFGLIVTAAGGLRAPVVALIPVKTLVMPGSGDPALIETATRVQDPCLTAGAWLACPLRRPGAYVLVAGDVLPAEEPVLARALATLPATQRAQQQLALIIAVVALAAVAGGAVAWLLGGGAGDR